MAGIQIETPPLGRVSTLNRSSKASEPDGAPLSPAARAEGLVSDLEKPKANVVRICEDLGRIEVGLDPFKARLVALLESNNIQYEQYEIAKILVTKTEVDAGVVRAILQSRISEDNLESLFRHPIRDCEELLRQHLTDSNTEARYSAVNLLFTKELFRPLDQSSEADKTYVLEQFRSGNRGPLLWTIAKYPALANPAFEILRSDLNEEIKKLQKDPAGASNEFRWGVLFCLQAFGERNGELAKSLIELLKLDAKQRYVGSISMCFNSMGIDALKLLPDINREIQDAARTGGKPLLNLLTLTHSFSAAPDGLPDAVPALRNHSDPEVRELVDKLSNVFDSKLPTDRTPADPVISDPVDWLHASRKQNGWYALSRNLAPEDGHHLIRYGLDENLSYAEVAAFFERVLEPHVFAYADKVNRADISAFVLKYSSEVPELKYLEYYHDMFSGKAGQYQGAFPAHHVGQSLKTRPKRIVLVDWITKDGNNTQGDGLGDEITRAAPYLGALLEMNPELTVDLVSRRGAQWQHPRIRTHKSEKALPPGEPDLRLNFKKGLYEHQYKVAIEYNKERAVVSFPPEETNLANPEAITVSDYNTLGNMYRMHLRTMAELGVGIPFRAGLRRAQGEKLHTAITNPIFDEYWRKEITPMLPPTTKTVLFNPYGGSYEEKGYSRTLYDQCTLLALIKELLNSNQSMHLLLATNGTNWGSESVAQKLVPHLPQELQRRIQILPPPGVIPTQYFIANSDYVLTREGGMMHIAANMGKPFAVFDCPVTMHGRVNIYDWIPPYSDRKSQVVVRSEASALAAVTKWLSGGTMH